VHRPPAARSRRPAGDRLRIATKTIACG
jgi:hypothetical protein